MAESEGNPSIVGNPLAVQAQDAVAELMSHLESAFTWRRLRSSREAAAENCPARERWVAASTNPSPGGATPRDVGGSPRANLKVGSTVPQLRPHFGDTPFEKTPFGAVTRKADGVAV